MARIAGVNIPQNKVVKTALTYIHGIGDKTANDICTELKIDKNKRTNALTDDEVLKIREFIDSKYSVEGDLRRNVSLDIKRLKDLGNYRGSRHRKDFRLEDREHIPTQEQEKVKLSQLQEKN